MKKIIALFLVLLLFCGCGQSEKTDKKLDISVTLFPQYDFLRQIAGDKAEITLLLPPGMESHNFEPGVGDIKKIAESDLFVYTGAQMEPWAETILDGIDSKAKILDASINIDLCADEHNHDHQHHDHHDHHEDPHVWTSPKNALIMAENILNALCEIDEENSFYYKENAEKYFLQLKELDEEFTSLSEKTKGITLCHGGKFSMKYLERDYGFEFLAAYDSCSSFAEPSAMRVKEIIDTVKKENLKGVFKEELNDGRIAQTIATEAQVDVFLLHTCHNLSKEDFLLGKTYISLMKQNAESIRKVTENAEG